MTHVRCFLSLGSNLGDSAGFLREAVKRANAGIGHVLRVSPVFRTAAWGKTDQPDFLNIAVEVETALEPVALMERLLGIEKLLGRVRTEKWGPRLIDIDLLFYGEAIVGLPGLHVPHPELHKRMFVLAPLHAIAPDLVHPVLKKTISQLLEECPDELEIHNEGELKIED
jgi:2-amino-4-hydroxy-6-hydroxymethyldihydropteridine diphosphokinase